GPRIDRPGRALNRGTCGAHRGDGGELSLDHGVEDLGRIPNVDVRIPRAGAFSFHGTHDTDESLGSLLSVCDLSLACGLTSRKLRPTVILIADYITFASGIRP